MTFGYVAGSFKTRMALCAQHEHPKKKTPKHVPNPLQQMKVRTITGTTYYMRSGASITGKVHERFMLVDGNRVATGSYR